MTALFAFGYDGSEEARGAIQSGARFLSVRSALVVHVYDTALAAPAVAGAPAVGVPLTEPPHEVLDGLEREARATAEEGAELARMLGLEAEPVVADARGRVADALMKAARDRGAEVLVVGSRGRGALKSAVLGSVSTGLVHAAELPVLVVPPR